MVSGKKKGGLRGLIRNRAIWLLAASFGILFSCFAQQPDSSGAPQAPPVSADDQTASFSGYVRTLSGAGIPGASVRVTNTALGKSWATWTDAQGKFSLPALPLGHYRIEATQIGFAQNAGEVTLSAYNQQPSVITLNVATLAQLNAPAENPAATASGNGSPASPPSGATSNQANAANGNPGNSSNGAAGGRGGFGGRGGNGGGNGGGFGANGRGRGGPGQGGAASANNQNGRGGQNGSAFSQTDLTGSANPNDQAQQVGSGDQFSADASLAGAGASGNSADSLVLQGTVGQGADFGGPGGPGGPGGFGPGGPGGIGGDIAFGTPGDAGAFTGAGGGTVGAGFGGGPGGGPGGGGFGGPGGGGPGGGGGGGRGGFGGGGGGGRGGAGGGGFAGGRGGRGGPNAAAGRLFRQRANRYRYTLYDTYNNSALNARPDTFTKNQVPKVSTYSENFGADAQGPLKIPHLYDGSGRTTLFLNYEHRTNESAANNESIVPTAPERIGNFCGVAGGVNFVNPYNPNQTLGCDLRGAPNLQTGTGTFTPDGAASNLLSNASYIPLPNLPTPTDQGYNYLLQLRTPSNTDVVNARVMHTINPKFNVTGAYAANVGRSKSIASFPDTLGNTSSLGQSITLTLSHNWSSRMVERTNASWSRSRSQLSSLTQFGTDIEGQLGILGQSALPVNYGLPGISFSSSGSLSEPVPSLTRNQTLLLSDALNFYRTKHTITLGGQIRDIDLNNNASPNPRGSFAFNGDFTCGSAFTAGTSGSGTGITPCTGTKTNPVILQPAQSEAYEVADLLIGLPYTVGAQYGTPQNIYLRSWGFAAYGQDDWRLTKSFTLQYGLRWDATKPTVEKYNHLANLKPLFTNGALTGVTVITPGVNGAPRALVNGAYENFGPRVGFAWITPAKKKRTVVRGGYSIFYNANVFTTLVRDFQFQSPFATSFSIQNSSANYFTIENGLLATPTSGITIPNTWAVDPNYKPYRAQTWNIGTETDLSRNWVLDLQYTGTAGANLDVLRSPNRAHSGTPQSALQQNLAVNNATQFKFDQSGATSLYNGMQARLLHRYTRGVSFQVQWTYSKSIDDASTVGGVGGGLIEQQDGVMSGLRGLSSFDQRHNITGNVTYELPFGQRYRFANHGWTNKLFGDWRLQNTVSWHTGNPLTVIMGGQDADPSGTGASGFTLPDQLPNVNPNTGVCGGGFAKFFNTAAFAAPASFGDAHKGVVEGPCSLQWNASMNKAFRLGNTDNQRRGEIQWNVTNVANHVNYSGVTTSFDTAQFGKVTSAGAMRSMSLTLRFNF